MLARQREIEGPFGEFPGYYSGGHRYPVIEVDRVSHRKNPIFEAVYVGLASTGFPVGSALAGAALALMVGTMLLVAARNRRGARAAGGLSDDGPRHL